MAARPSRCRVDERQRLTEALIDSMPPESVDEIERAWSEEALHRAGQLERGEIQARDGETAFRELMAKHRRPQ
ncbi:MAG: addiction module protein [Deltaproteobacteria bacterium]|nr:addiction module protein [Deltaproteobacteria bacterium]